MNRSKLFAVLAVAVTISSILSPVTRLICW